jgi:hypothetical protein
MTNRGIIHFGLKINSNVSSAINNINLILYIYIYNPNAINGVIICIRLKFIFEKSTYIKWRTTIFEKSKHNNGGIIRIGLKIILKRNLHAMIEINHISLKIFEKPKHKQMKKKIKIRLKII